MQLGFTLLLKVGVCESVSVHAAVENHRVLPLHNILRLVVVQIIDIDLHLEVQSVNQSKHKLDLEPQNHGVLPNMKFEPVSPLRSIRFEHLNF